MTATSTQAPTNASSPDSAPTNQYVAVVDTGAQVEVLTSQVETYGELLDFANEAAAQGEVLSLEKDAQVHALDQVPTWGFEDVKFAPAWGSPPTATGGDVRVAVLDTGADTGIVNGSDPVHPQHPDLSGRWDTATTADFVNALDPANPGPVTADPNGHGTHVAGIIAALDDAQGVVGGAPGARLVPVRVLDANGAGWNSDVADAIRWAADIDTGNAAVISMSLGGPSSAAIAAAIAAVEDPANTQYTHPVIVAAAGNATCSGPQYPAALSSTTPEVIAVSALCKPGTTGSCPATTPFPADPYQLATFSSVVWNGSGTIRGLAAPGVAINSTWPSSGYATKSGTSMATPFVAAAAALVAAHCPAYGAADVVARLQSTAHDLGPAGPDKLYGAGMVDAQEAVAPAC